MSLELDIEGERLQASLRARMFGETLPQPRVGKYRLDEPIGAGSMGTVYRAIDDELERPVALKLLRADAGGEVAIARLVREAKALARLNHPNVVTIHEAGQHGERSYIAMELVDGQSLQRWTESHPERTPERFRRALELMLDAADALEAAHRAGIVHRDLKPANILIGEDGRLRLADFGLALADSAPSLGRTEPADNVDPSDPSVQALTATGRFVGTPAYMAPEQFDGQTSPRSDQFSFCAAFFEAFYGVRPYAGSTLTQLRFAIAQRDLADVPSASGVPRWMYGLLARGLDPDPDARLPSMAAMIDAVHDADRRTGRVKVGLGSLGVFGIGLAAWAMWPAASDEPSACDGVRAALDNAWGAARRTAIRDAFTATQVSFAETTFAEVDATLNRYADAWLTERLEACREVDASAGAPALARVQCLDEGLVALESTVSVLESVGGTKVIEAPAVTLALPAPTVCAQRVAPRPPGRVDEARRLVRAIARGEAMFSLGDEQAVEVLTAAATDASEADLPALEARASTRLALAVIGRDDLHGSLKWAERGLQAAERAENLPEQFDAWIRLAQTQDTLQLASKSFSLRRAASVLERIGEPSWRDAQLRWTEASVNFDDDDPTGKVAKLEQALTLIGPLRDAHPITYGGILTDLGTAQLRTGKVTEGLTNLEAGVVTYEGVYGSGSPRIAGVLTGLAQAQMHNDALEQSYQTATRAHTLLGLVPSWHPNVRSAAALMRGMTLTLLDRPEEAVPILQEAIDLNLAAGHGEARYNVRVAQAQLGSAYGKLDRWQEAVAIYDDVIESELESERADFPAGALRMNLANACSMLGLEDRTAQAIAEGRAIIEALVPAGTLPHTEMLRVVAYAWVQVGKHAAGLRVADEALAHEGLSDRMQGQLLLARAQALDGLDRRDEATAAGELARAHLLAAGKDGAPLLDDIAVWEAERSG